jgi:hypothetical protein
MLTISIRSASALNWAKNGSNEVGVSGCQNGLVAKNIWIVQARWGTKVIPFVRNGAQGTWSKMYEITVMGTGSGGMLEFIHLIGKWVNQ